MIANECQECREVLYVEQGRYNIGYEINKKVYYGLQLGKLSVIGGYQVCNNQRFEFIYKTCSPVRAHAIRKENFLRVLNSWP